MKGNIALMTVLGAFFLIAAVVYTVWNVLATGTWEVVGTVGILLSAILAGFIAFFLNAVNRSQGGILLPEDRPEADIDDADPELGHFSPWSWWPFVLGLAIGLAFLGLAVGVWIAIVGIPLVIIALVGWTYEYYRGNFGH
jgi:membrane protein implicated in regulation of membrane protease activity